MNKVYSLRLHPEQDLKNEIQNFCNTNNISAGCILSAVGSLKIAKLRLAGSDSFFEATGKFEIVSVTGTVSKNGSHIHLALADQCGKVVGGHLMDGNSIYTTCELVLLSIENQEFKREQDSVTGFKELVISLKS